MISSHFMVFLHHATVMPCDVALHHDIQGSSTTSLTPSDILPYAAQPPLPPARHGRRNFFRRLAAFLAMPRARKPPGKEVVMIAG
jgi:hypothetical protein